MVPANATASSRPLSSSPRSRGHRELPDGYRAIPISNADRDAALRLCVVVRSNPEPAAGPLVTLADLHDALVYLGCVVDASGAVREWLEIAVQNVDGLAAALPTHREAFSNHALDTRWAAAAAARQQLDPDGTLVTGAESRHPLPCFLDVNAGTPVHPADPDGTNPWQLCQADDLLGAAGLPAYGTSLYRYLHQPAGGAQGSFIPVVAGAPQGPRTKSPQTIAGQGQQLVPFNPQAGLLAVSTLHPVAFEDYVDLLGGKPWKGIEHGRKHLALGGPYQGLDDWNQALQGGAHLFAGGRGHHGHLAETFHLKIQLLHDMLRQVRLAVQDQQLPFLNLDKDSFRVRLGETGAGLPFLWTARAQLVKPSHAFALPIDSSDFRHFIRARVTGPSIYLPEGLGDSIQGNGSVRLRKVHPPEGGRTVVEGTLVTQEPLAASINDLLWIRLTLPTGRIDLYGHLQPAEGQPKGEVRFRTHPQPFPDETVKALAAAEGVAFARSPFEIVPLLSTPCDLYSLGVLAARTLLVDEENTLAVAVDELISLARQVASQYQPDIPAALRVRAVFEKDDRYRQALGPHRLIRQDLTSEQGFAAFPTDLWYDTLASLISLFPGIGPDSACKDFGDVPALALENAFDAPLERFEKLLLRSRSLIVIDWNANREVHAAIQSFLERNKAVAG